MEARFNANELKAAVDRAEINDYAGSLRLKRMIEQRYRGLTQEGVYSTMIHVAYQLGVKHAEATGTKAPATQHNGFRIFENPEFGTIRTMQRDGEPWFVAADVCRVLELGNSRQAVVRLDSDEKGVISTDTPGGTQQMTIINEPGLYSLVLGSRKPEARAFKRWLTHEVLPTLRKEGSCAVEPTNPAPEPPRPATRTEIMAMNAQTRRLCEIRKAIKAGMLPREAAQVYLSAGN